MKILTVNTSDIQGGAARAAYRLHRSLLAQGVDSQMLVQDKKSDDYTVLIESSKTRKYFNKIRPLLDGFSVRFYKSRSQTLFSPAITPFSRVVSKINQLNPDIVHLHWVNGGMMRVEDIAKIKAPVVWSLHDMWAFTGGCHIDKGCGKYLQSCGKCPILGSHKKHDLSRFVFKRKAKTYDKKQDMTVVGLSQWLAELAQKSALLSNKRIVNLPNPINTSTFKPFDKTKARELWSLPQDKQLALFGAIGATSDPNKGFDKLTEALGYLSNNNIEFVVFGSSESMNPPDLGFKVHYTGHLHDDISLITLYSSCDVMVVPSLQENLSNTIMESMSCGTPVVGFDIGGNGDMIDHKHNGYLAKPYNTQDLSQGIEWVLNHKNYDELSAKAREKVVNTFDNKVLINQYITLYKEILT